MVYPGLHRDSRRHTVKQELIWVHDGEIHYRIVVFSDEAWLKISGDVST